MAFKAWPVDGYYRYPALHGDTLIFSSEGDLWRVPAGGGLAQRLTSHPGMESHAAISPDGKSVAFTAEYEGPTEVYVMAVDGGLPRRITFEGGGNGVAGWAPDGRLMILTHATSTLPSDRLALIDLPTLSRTYFPLAEASQGVLAPDTGLLVFTRLPRQGSSTKRYKGGWIQDLWSFGPNDNEARPLTGDYAGTSKDPMWWQGRVYFLSDRDGIMNVWSMRPDGSDLRQVTHHREIDAADPALNEGRIVYQQGPDLRLLDLARETDTVISIRLASDFDQEREHWVKKPVDYLTAAHISPDGDRLVLTARGQVFVAPVEDGRFVEIPRATRVRYRNARFLPDGTNVVALSDASGELEFWRLPANGVGQGRALTTNATVFRFEGVPSPDGQWLAWSDKDLRFWIHRIGRGETRLITESRTDPIRDFSWSPDSQWLAYVEEATNTFAQIKLYHVRDGSLTTVTGNRVNSFNPAWSPDGQWLYFLSDRDLRSLVNSPWGPRQPDPFFTETTRIYQLALTAGLRFPFAPKDELTPEESKEKDKEKDKDKKKENEADTSSRGGGEDGAGSTHKPSAVSVTIDLAGLPGRLYELPVPAGNYRDLTVTAKHVLWVENHIGFDANRDLRRLEITPKDPKAKTLVEDIKDYELSGDRKKILIRKGDDFHVIDSDANAPAKLDEKVKLEGWAFSVDPREEWNQIYTEAWRMMRDFYYDRGMQHVDWPAMRRKYQPWVDRVRDRAELSDVIAAMVGELSTLHIFVRFGDEREGPDHIATSSLGARLIRDEAAGGWRVEHIYRTDPAYPTELAPLAKPGVEVAEGDVILGINGRPTLSVRDPGDLLRNQAGRQVLLELKPVGEGGTRRAIVKPISSAKEADLRYDEWELTRRQRVEELGQGQIGYVHLRAMGQDNIAEWARDFYPVFQRQGLIIDVRNNHGGNIDSWVLGKLLRRAWFYWKPRVGNPIWNMQYAFRGHMVVLCNARTASDGEAFTEGFRRLGLGKIIGTRTWGGEIWLSAERWLVDSGMATAAELGVYGPRGEWLIEGHGVDPDILVDNLPHATYEGADAQLETAIGYLQGRIAKEPNPLPAPPPYPDKSFPRQ